MLGTAELMERKDIQLIFKDDFIAENNKKCQLAVLMRYPGPH